MASLIPTRPQAVTIPEEASSSSAGEAVTKVQVHQVVTNRQQPRTEFDESALDELASSVRRNGILQPLLVTPLGGDRYELIAGERRLRAARLVGLEEVPVIIRHKVDTDEMLELALIENIQREDLNAIEEAKAYAALMDQFGYTQEEVADRVGKSRVTITNSLRLLQLPKVVQDDVVVGRLSAGHARSILAIGELQEQLAIREQILKSQLSVRDVERIVQQRRGYRQSRPRHRATTIQPSAQIKTITEEMMRATGTKVEVRSRTEQSGMVMIEYYSLQDLDRVYRRVTGQ